MQVAFDAQIILEKEKTGIAWNAKYIIDAMVRRGDFKCQLNFYKKHFDQDEKKVIEAYREKGCQIEISKVMPKRIYERLSRKLPIPYKWMFGDSAQATIFFNYSIPYGVAGKSFVYICDVNYLVHPETVQKKTFKWLKNNLVSYCNRADFILTISEFSKGEIMKHLHVSQKKIQIVPCGVDDSYLHLTDLSKKRYILDKYKLPKQYYLYLGTIEPRKNIGNLIEAYINAYAKDDKIWPLVIAGKKGWYYEEYFARVKEKGLENNILFPGYIDDDDKAALIEQSQCFIFISIYEGFGIPILEAMACNVPVITSNVTSIPEIAGNAAYYVDPYNPTMIGDAMIILMNDKKKREELVEKGKKQVKKFTWDRSAEILTYMIRKGVGDGAISFNSNTIV